MDYDAPKFTECSHCGAPVVFVLAEKSGKVNILDAEPVEHGNAAIINRRAVYHSKSAPLPDGIERYVSHFATCPNADAVRAELTQRTKESDQHAKRGSWE